MTSAVARLFGTTWLTHQRRLGVGVLALVLVLAAVVRFYRLDSQSFWLDEAHTYGWAAMPPAEAIATSIKRDHVPTYFVLMHYWLRFGDGEAMLRAPSAVFGVLTVAAGMLLGWIVAGFRPALASGVLTALSPLQVGYSQEARMYTMFTFTATLAMCGLAWLLKERDRAQTPLWQAEAWQPHIPPPAGEVGGARLWLHIPASGWLVYVAATVATLYLHNTGVFLVAASSLCMLGVLAISRGRRWIVLGNWVLANLAVLALWSLWIHALLRQTNRLLRHFWPDFPNPATIWATLSRLYLYGEHSALLGVLLVGLSGWGVMSLRKRPELALGLVILALSPPLLVLLVSLRTPMFLPRIMLWAAVPFFVLVATGMFALRMRALPWLALAAVIVGGFFSLEAYYQRDGRKPPWHEVARLLSEQYDSDAVVFATSGQERSSLSYYYQRRHKALLGVPIVAVEPWEMQDYMGDVQTVWLLDGKVGSRAGTKTFREEIERHGHLVWQKKFGNVNLFKYSLDPQLPPEPRRHPVRREARDPDADDPYFQGVENEG